jgi:hypothetical protein
MRVIVNDFVPVAIAVGSLGPNSLGELKCRC